MYISSEYRSKLDPKLKKYVFIDYTKGVKGFKLWDSIKNNMVININVVFDEKLFFKQSFAKDVSAFEGETSNKQVIQCGRRSTTSEQYIGSA